MRPRVKDAGPSLSLGFQLPFDDAESIAQTNFRHVFGAEAQPVLQLYVNSATLQWCPVPVLCGYVAPWIWKKRERLLPKRLEAQAWACAVLVASLQGHMTPYGAAVVKYLQYLGSL